MNNDPAITYTQTLKSRNPYIFFPVREENKYVDHDPTCGSDSRERSGYKQNFIPSEAPGNVTPRIRRIINMIQGNVAVTYTTQQEEANIRKVFSSNCNKATSFSHPFCYQIKNQILFWRKRAFDAFVHAGEFGPPTIFFSKLFTSCRKGQHFFGGRDWKALCKALCTLSL